MERFSLSKHFALGWTEEKWLADMVLLIPYSYPPTVIGATSVSHSVSVITIDRTTTAENNMNPEWRTTACAPLRLENSFS